VLDLGLLALAVLVYALMDLAAAWFGRW